MTGVAITCVGELLWDELPGERTLGGAPANVAYHLGRLGVAARLVTRVGRDEPGEAARAALRERGLAVDGVQVDDHLPTGAARVVLDGRGQADYAFVTPAAWDAIEPDDAPADVVVHGTLAQRDPRSAQAIRAMAARAAVRVFDVNLRPPHTPLAAVAGSLALATLVKMNEDEAGSLASALDLPRSTAGFAAALVERFGVGVVCITRAAAGAAVLAEGRWIETPGVAVATVDTVGAGDAFLAALLAGWQAGRDWPTVLARAARLGAWVAARRGGMPDYDAAAPA